MMLPMFSVISILALASSTVAFDRLSDNQAECPPGYKVFNREEGRKWCIKFFLGNQTFFEAEKVCRCDGGASLSGLENSLEFNYVKSQAEEVFFNNSIENGGVLLGAYRRKACRGEESKWQNKPECTSKNMFQWTDRNTIGNKMFKWIPNAPHSNITNNVQENCVQLLISIELSGENADLSEHMNNKDCNLQGSPDGKAIFENRGFVCGRPALFNDDCNDDGGYNDVLTQILIGAGKPKPKPKA